MASPSDGGAGPSDPSRSNRGQSDVEAFIELTHCDEDQATFYLEACQGQLEHAIARFFDEASRGVDDSDVGADSYDSPYEAEPVGREPHEAPIANHRSPFGFLRGGLNVVFRALQIAASVFQSLGNSLLPANLVRALQDPTQDAEIFVASFCEQYGEGGPQWMPVDWSQATRGAHQQFKLLFIYLHSPYHQDTEQFCRSTLMNAELSRYVNQNFACWGGNITKSEAYRLSQKLRVTGYPYVCLLAYSGLRVRLAAFVKGNLPPEQLLAHLQEVQESQSTRLVAERLEQEEQVMNRNLREEQDAAYQRSLQEDRDREERREKEHQAEETKRRQAEEAAQQERQQREQEARQAADRVSALESRQKSKASTLRPEAEVGHAEGIATVRIRLPDGSNHQRRFVASRPIQDVYDFVDSLESFKVWSYNLVSSYPKKILEKDAAEQSFRDMGLTPQATLFVQSLDD